MPCIVLHMPCIPTSAGTPRGAPDSQTKHCIDGLHGNALAVGALLVASARSALGAPSRLTRSVFWIAKRMISQPYCRWVPRGAFVHKIWRKYAFNVKRI
jgi:hypothetical protein